jgi:hypothetical protein
MVGDDKSPSGGDAGIPGVGGDDLEHPDTEEKESTTSSEGLFGRIRNTVRQLRRAASIRRRSGGPNRGARRTW